MATDTTSYLHFLDVDWIKERSTLNDGFGLPFTNRFLTLLNAPTSGTQLKENGWLELQVLSVDVPNFNIEPTELELNGARRFYFKGRGDGELGITFLDTPNLLLRRFFLSWMKLAVDVSQVGDSKNGGVRRGYMNEYMPTPSEFLIFPLDFKGNAKYVDRFSNIFPYDISGISYNYAQAGEVIKTTVKFKYMYHDITPINDVKGTHLSEDATYNPNSINTSFTK